MGRLQYKVFSEVLKKQFEKIRVDRLNRHLYDVYQLSKAIEDKNLYTAIVEHLFNFAKISGIDYNLLLPKKLYFIPINNVKEVWERNYKKMKEEIFINRILQQPKPIAQK